MKQIEDPRVSLGELIVRLCAVPTVSGLQGYGEEVARCLGNGFDEIQTDRLGSCVLIRRCGRPHAPKILVDAHLDEVGLMVSQVCDGGFLKIVPVGGLDPAVLQAADVTVYGKETLRGVICSTPPHLRTEKDGKLPQITEMMVDVGCGYDKKELEAICPVGTPIGFSPAYRTLLGDRILGKSFDDKACAACAAYGIAQAQRERLAGDVYLLLSRYEETSRIGGVSPAVFAIAPDYAMVADVNLGRVPDVPKHETVVLGEGISLSLSAATDLVLTRRMGALCDEQEIPYVYSVAAASTGTNATSVQLSGGGVPVVDVGLPLQSMHTPCEVIHLGDCEALARLVNAFVCDEATARSCMEKEVVLK